MRSWQRIALAMFAVGWGANQFTPLLIAYRDELGMSVQTRAFLFGVYAAGLVPALLVGGAASDRWGRRAVVLPFVALSPLATVLLIVEHDSVAGLAVGRLLAGACSGVVFSAATAWVSELSETGAGPRRAAIALSAGFGAGPFVTGLVGQWAPRPLETPYLPHVVLGLVALVLMARVPGPRPEGVVLRPLIGVPDVTRGRRFLLVVAPSAPWVFGCAALSIAYLPGEIGGSQSGALAFVGVLSGLTLGCGVAVQGVARRLDDRRPLLAGQVGLLAALVGASIGVLALVTDVRWLLLLGAPILGGAYGCVLVSGLRETERLSHPDERGATVAVFYALTYLGFALPYLLGAFGGGVPALVGAIGAIALSLVVVSVAGRRPLAASRV
ncbi:MFS transporter [Nocardioides rubriscoriae]|uniref:MFS transporter n=1 Tax=Nocardioides rubriscoriae TaxID=642762 RepID=UPI0014786BEF|nr:MFS transporter [Nocardioides rubriscoriae]